MLWGTVMNSNGWVMRSGRQWLCVILRAFVASVLLGQGVALASEAAVLDRQPAIAAQRARMIEAFGRSPLHFEPNQGQAAENVKFVARAPGYQLYLTPNAAVLALRGKEQTSSLVQMQLAGDTVNPKPVMSGMEALPGRSHYYLGNDPQHWQTDVPHFAKVRYSEVYPGVDWVLYGNPRQLEYDFVVAPGVDPTVINLSLAGADQARIADDGELVVSAAGREVLHSSPTIYQVVNGERRKVDGRYVLRESAGDAPVVGFEIAAYNPQLPLVIDPVVYFTFVGGAPDDDTGVGGDDRGLSIAVDSAGNAYITGSTSTNNANVGDAGKQFPTTSLAINQNFSGGTDAFVTRMDAAGTIIYSTYFGGSAFDVGYGIAVDNASNAYVTGSTNSDNFPQTIKSTAEQVDEDDNTITITTTTPLSVVRPEIAYSKTFAATGSTTPYTWTVDGGSLPPSLTLSSVGVLSGTSTIDQVGSYNFIVKVEDNDDPKNITRKTFTLIVAALQGTQDAFVTKINANGQLGYSTYLGGAGNESGYGIAVNGLGEAYVTGYTTSTGNTTSTKFPGANFPTAASLAANGEDAFIVKVNAAGNGLVYSRLTNFTGNDRGQGIVLDSAGTSAYITGYRNSPTNEAAFIAKVNTTGVISSNTSLDGPSNERGLAIARDELTGVYITGYTSSISGIATEGAYDTTFNGPTASQDAFVAKYTDSGSAFALNYATYLGGFSNDVGYGIAVDSFGNAFVAGETFSPGFPMVAADDNVAAKSEAFLSRLNEDGTKLTYSSFWGGAENDSGRGLAKDFPNDVYMVGYTNSLKDGFVLDPITPYRDYSGGADAFVTKFSIPVINTDSNTLTVTRVGSGTVTSVPDGIDCGVDCEEAYEVNTEVTLTAKAGDDSIFAGWAGVSCEGGNNSGATCTVKMDADKTVTANFLDPDTFTLTVKVTGRGVVISSPEGIRCGSGAADCTKDYNRGKDVTLAATAAPGLSFVGWSGCDSNPSVETCSIKMNEAKSVTAVFREESQRSLIVNLKKGGSSTGSVISDPSGINCGDDCQESYDTGTRVTLTAQSGTDSVFNGWSEPTCNSADPCTVTLDSDKIVIATFSDSNVGVDLTLVSPKPATADGKQPAGKNGQRNISFELNVENNQPFETGLFQASLYFVPPDKADVFLPTDSTVFSAGKECRFSSLPAGTGTSTETGTEHPPCIGSIVLPNVPPKELPAGDYKLGVYSQGQRDATDQIFTVKRLKVTVEESGNGTVYSQPSGIVCNVSTNCDIPFLYGDKVTLTQAPKTDGQDPPKSLYTFLYWSGSCVGLKDCELALYGEEDTTNITARYWDNNNDPTQVVLAVYKTGTGTGTVTADDATAINCGVDDNVDGADCWQAYAKADNKTVTLTAKPDASTSSSFTGWNGACTGTAATCTVTMNAIKTVTATFVSPATELITHYYTSILGRAPDPTGLAFWQGLIAERQAAGVDVKPVFRDMANFFFNSPEYLGNNTSDTQFITDLYRTFFQREPDADGLTFWQGELAAGKSRNDVMADFLYSQEFTDFMAELGL